MKRLLTLSALGLASLLGSHGAARADVDVRVPFVRVYVGDGVYVRAPFVRVFVPRGRTYYEVPAQPMAPNDAAPAETAVNPPMTHQDFAKNFKAQAGHYDVAMINPVTKSVVNVRFTLPEGTPQRVTSGRRHVELLYGPDHWVRFEFDARGVVVTSR